MKIKFLFLIISFLLIYSEVDSQIILKRKKLEEQLLKIDSLIKVKRYEDAMLLFDSKEKVILEDNVPKKLMISFDNIKTTLGVKKKLFEDTKIRVENLIHEFELKHYCNSIDLINLDLNFENSFLETQKIKNALLPDLKSAKEKCESYSKKVEQWNAQFDNNEFESLYPLLAFDDSEKNYFFNIDLMSFNHLVGILKAYKAKADIYSDCIKLWKKSFDNENYESIYYLLEFDDSEKKFFLKNDLSVFNDLISKLQEKNNVYKEISKFIENKTSKIMEQIDYSLLDLKQAKSLIDTLKSNLIETDRKFKEAPGINPNLENEYRIKRVNVEIEIEKLQSYFDKKEAIKISNNNSKYPILNFDDFTLVFSTLHESNELRNQDKIVGAERLEKEAQTMLSKIVIPNKKYIIKSENNIFYHLSIEWNGGEIFCSKDENGISDNTMDYRFTRYNQNFETSDLILEKLENLPKTNSGSNNYIQGNFTLLVQAVPIGAGIFGQSKYYYARSYGDSHVIGIYIKILDVY